MAVRVRVCTSPLLPPPTPWAASLCPDLGLCTRLHSRQLQRPGGLSLEVASEGPPRPAARPLPPAQCQDPELSIASPSHSHRQNPLHSCPQASRVVGASQRRSSGNSAHQGVTALKGKSRGRDITVTPLHTTPTHPRPPPESSETGLCWLPLGDGCQCHWQEGS